MSEEHKQLVTNRNAFNAAKLREALELCVKMLDICLMYSPDGYPSQGDDIQRVIEKGEAALAAPPEPVGNNAKMRDTHGAAGCGWVGFDLDGTLAEYHGWKGVSHIGVPVKPMVDLIKRLHADGEVVRILTARVANDNTARKPIEEWCAKNLGFIPEITHEKDQRMITLYDDRVKQVVPNEGVLVEEMGNNAKMRDALLAVKELDFYKEEDCHAFCRIIESALSAPPRNCDRYPTFAAAIEAWRDIDPCVAGSFDDWLFAEAEGDAE